ncbi:ribonuclease III [Saccharomycopsis crataegensis]|uniref:Ribonuclease III n=1 Tax=Saccharomycopsis crataegensis TaxID=43959 RepID=A0AAV5QXS8_9ASCO|nr:ribonuclease III [Saccharomycopsis crataegensis]
MTLETTTIHTIAHASSQISSALKQILDLTPNFEELQKIDKNPDTSNEIRGRINNGNFQLAVMLKSLYQKNKLPILNEILDPKLASRLSLDYIKRFDAKANSTLQTKASENVDPEKDVYKFIEKNSKHYPPSIPPIRNHSLEVKVFTHKSLSRADASQDEKISFTNERLEFQGDSVLNFIMTDIICEWFPSYDQGQLSSLRQSLIKNDRLVEWSKLYRLEKKLCTSKVLNINVSGDEMAKRYADVFEAYVGALWEENQSSSFHTIKQWLKMLAIPVIKNHLKTSGVPAVLNSANSQPLCQMSVTTVDQRNYVGELYSLVGYAANPPKYDIRRLSETHFVATVSISGEELGTGDARNTKLAKKAAAKDALENHKDLVQKYHDIRSKIPKNESIGSKLNEPQGDKPHNNSSKKSHGVGKKDAQAAKMKRGFNDLLKDSGDWDSKSQQKKSKHK